MSSPVRSHAPRQPDVVRRVCAVVARAVVDADGGIVLAVSGGRDSMTMLDAMVSDCRTRIAAVATFDHGTGAHAEGAIALVQRVAESHGLPVLVGRAHLAGAGEARWRDERWAFLRRSARPLGARWVATAHTGDDQIETVAMRLLRGAGTRGLAGLAVRSADVVRPLLALRAAEVAEYASARGLVWVDDPTNRDAAQLRARLRHELLPSLERLRPGFGAVLRAIGDEAAAWRAQVEAVVDALVVEAVDAAGAPCAWIDAAHLAGVDAETAAMLWVAIAARVGARLDRRAVARAVRFTAEVLRARAEGTHRPISMPIAGGGTIRFARSPQSAGVRRSGTPAPPWAFIVTGPADGEVAD